MPVIQPLPCHDPRSMPVAPEAGRPPVTPVIRGPAAAQEWHVRIVRIIQLGYTRERQCA